MRKTLTLYALTLFSFVVILSCKKEKTNPPAPKDTIPINISISHLAVDFLYLNVSFNSIPKGKLQYTKFYSYIPFNIEDNKLTVVTERDDIDLKLNTTVFTGFEKNNYYSVFITDSNSIIRTFLVKEDTTKATGDSCRLRFINFAPRSHKLNLSVRDGATLIRERYFADLTGSIAEFKSFKSGNYYLELRDSNTDTVKFAAPNFDSFLPGHSYTIVAKGIDDPLYPRLTIGSVQNF